MQEIRYLNPKYKNGARHQKDVRRISQKKKYDRFSKAGLCELVIFRNHSTANPDDWTEARFIEELEILDRAVGI